MVAHEDWSTAALEHSHLIPARRISASSSSTVISKAIASFEKSGEPLVIEGFQDTEGWDSHIFKAAWLRKHYKNKDGDPILDVRNVKTRQDSRMHIRQFMDWASNVQPDDSERYYGKDAVCPEEYEEWLHSGIITEQLVPNQPGNLLMNLPEEDRVGTLMCYLGVGETFTPCHKDLSGSSGQNLMTYADEGASSTWILTKTSAAREVSEFFQSLGHELDHETHVLTMDELKKATFDVYYVEQRLGDLVLVPPRSCHQVVNLGGLTIKTSWSRMTPLGLALALYYELPLYQRVCRAETYRIKSTIDLTLRTLTAQVNSALASGGLPTPQQVEDLSFILPLYERIVHSEDPGPDALLTLSPESSTTAAHDVSGILCDFCAADIYNGFFECKRQCRSEPIELHPTTDNKFVVCPGCYCEGRTCACQCMKAIQCRSFKQLQVPLAAARETLERASVDPKFALLKAKCPSVFQAARFLQKSRDEQDTLKNYERKCRTGSHPVPLAESINCNGCHATRCLGHILSSSKMHSMEALLLCQSKERKKDFHAKHLESRLEFEAQVQILRENELRLIEDPPRFTPPDILKQSADISLTYSRVQPAKASAQRGWYDMPDEYEEQENVVIDRVITEKDMKPKPRLSRRSASNSRPLKTIDDNTTIADESRLELPLELAKEQPTVVSMDIQETTILSASLREALPSSSKRTLSNDDAGTSQQEGRSPKRPRPDSTALMNDQSPRVPDNAIVEGTLEQQKQDEHILMLSTKLALLEKELQDVKTIAFTLVGTVTPSTTMLMHQAMSEMHVHYQKPCMHNPCRGATGCPDLAKYRSHLKQVLVEGKSVTAVAKKETPAAESNVQETPSTSVLRKTSHVHFSGHTAPAGHSRSSPFRAEGSISNRPVLASKSGGDTTATLTPTYLPLFEPVKSEPFETTLPSPSLPCLSASEHSLSSASSLGRARSHGSLAPGKESYERPSHDEPPHLSFRGRNHHYASRSRGNYGGHVHDRERFRLHNRYPSHQQNIVSSVPPGHSAQQHGPYHRQQDRLANVPAHDSSYPPVNSHCVPNTLGQGSRH